MAKIRKEVLKEIGAIFEKHKKKHPNRKMTEKELDKLLDSELKPEFVRRILNMDKKEKFTNYNNLDELKKEIEKLEEQNEFLRDLVKSLKDVKAGRTKEFK
jgi:thymidylate synthase